MASIVLSGDTSGTVTLSAPAVAGSTTQTLVNVTGTLAPIVSATAQTAPFAVTTYAEFTGIPSWAERITVMFDGVSTSGTSLVQIQIGAGSVTTSGYTSAAAVISSGTAQTSATTGFLVTGAGAAADVITGTVVFTNITGNTWIESGTVGYARTAGAMAISAGKLALGGTLDRVRITTVNGTDTFDAGSINIMYE